MMNTKAKFMIVTPTNPKKSNFMIINNEASTIVPPPLLISLTKCSGVIGKHQRVEGGNALCLFLFPMIKSIT